MGSKAHKKRRRISSRACVNCRAKKIKCDCEKRFPCTHCKNNSKQCILVEDKRAYRQTSDYIQSLEKRVKDYEDEIARLKQLGDPKHDSVVNQRRKLRNGGKKSGGKSSNTGDLTPESSNDNSLTSDSVNKPEVLPITEHRIVTENSYKYPWPRAFGSKFNTEPVSVYGPTSVFDCIPVKFNRADSNGEDKALELGQLNKDVRIIACIKLFFNWLYPDLHMFIHREAFLLDFFHPKEDDMCSSYCSKELVYAVAAIGASVSANDEISGQSYNFYRMALSGLLIDFEHPSIPAMQAFDLLGLYDIYNGRNNSGWILTGMGLRMGFNLGYQLNPKSWKVSGTKNNVSDLTISIRSRIFWGSFVLDHFVSLLLGRPALLQISDTTIQESEATPDIDWIGEYTFPGYSKVIDISTPLRSIVRLLVLADDVLHKIFFTVGQRVNLLQESNDKIAGWRDSLPDSLVWDSVSLRTRATDPTRMLHIYYYYIVQLCLNRPFVKVDNACSSEVCDNAIADLYVAIKAFTGTHGYHKCSVVIIYACIISVSVILLSASKKSDENSNDESSMLLLCLSDAQKEHFFTFMDTLHRLSKTWNLSRKSYEMISHKLSKDYGLNFYQQYKIYQQESRNSSSSSSLGTPESGEVNHNGVFTDYQDSTSIDYAELLYNSFGGPPLLMNPDIVSTDWESLFPDLFGPDEFG